MPEKIHDFNSENSDRANNDRVVVSLKEHLEALDIMKGVKRGVTFFGSARFNKNNKYYKLTKKTAELFAESGFSVITGGGPGVMAAANEGAAAVDGDSIGLGIKLPNEQGMNPYINKGVEFKYFYNRKVALVKDSQIFMIMPGGYGTMDEFFEVLTLRQTKRMGKRLIIMMPGKLYEPLMNAIDETFRELETIDDDDSHFYKFADTPQQAITLAKDWVFKNFDKLHCE